MEKIRDFMESNLEGDFTFEDLAGSIGLSRTLFFVRFRRTTQQSPNQFLQMLRVKRVKQLLRDGRLPTAEIALACGFSDQAYMTRVFGRLVGTTPGRYRHDQR